MAAERYVVMTVECPRCKTKQTVHVNAHPGISPMSDQRLADSPVLRQDNSRIPDSHIGTDIIPS